MKSTLKQIGSTAARLLACAVLLAASSALAATYTWTNSTGTSLTTTTSWNPNGTPSATAGDTIIWNGTAAGNLDLVMTADITGNPGVIASLTSGQTGYVTITNNAANRAIRFNQGNSLNVASGAGALTFGAGGGSPATPFQIALGVGNGAIHSWTNNSANPVTIHTNVYFVMGGGGTHMLNLAGTGNFIFNNTIQPNNGAGLNLTANGPGSVTVMGTYTPSVTWASGSAYSQTILNGGTLICGGNNSIGTNNFTINGGRLDSVTANLTNMLIAAQNWNGNFTFVGSQSLNLGAGPVSMGATRIVTVSASTLAVDGVISGAGGLTKAGAGTLALGGANTYSGGTVVSNGVLKLANATALGASGANLTAHGVLDLNGNSPTVGNLIGNSTGVIDDVAGAGSDTLTVSNSSSGTFAGVIKNTTGSLALTKIGSGALTLSGANTYSGNTTVNAGSLLVNGSLGSGAVTVVSGATVGGTGTIGGTVDWQSGAAATLSLTPTTGAGSNSTPLTVSGSVTLNGNLITVNVLGGTPLGVGTYKLMGYNNTGSSGAFSTGSPTYTGAGVASGTASTVATSGGVVTVTVANTGLSTTWTNNGDGSWTTGANWNSNPAYPQNPGDAAFLGVGSAYTTVTLNAPISVAAVTFTNGNSFRIADAGNALTMNNPYGSALITVNAGSSNTIAAPVALATNLTVATLSGTALNLTNTISNVSGSQRLTVNGPGTVVLSGINTYGPTAGAVGTIFGGGGTLQLNNASTIGAGDLSVASSGTISVSVPMTVANNIIASSGTATLNDNGNNVTVSGVISGAGALGKNGAGMLSLSSANSYAGDTSISAGSVKLLNAAGIPGGLGYGNVNMGASTSLDMNGNSVVLGGLNSTPSSAAVDSLTGEAVTLSLGGNGAFASFAGSIKNTSGSLTLVKNGAGTQTLTGTNTYTGGTTINAGTLQIGNGGTTGTIGSGTVANNGNLTFNLAATNIFAGQITGTGAVTLNNGSLNLWLTGNNASWTGPINFFGGNLWVTNSTGLGVGPKIVQPSNPNSAVHLDGSLGDLNLDSSITFNLSGPALFNEAGSNTISGPIGMVNGNGNISATINSGFLTLAGNVSTVTGNNARTLILGGAGNGTVSGNITEPAPSNPTASLTKQDAGTWTLAGTGNNYSGATTVSGGTLIIDGNLNGNGAIAVNGGTLLLNGTDNGTGAATVAAGGAFGGVGTMFSPVTWQAGSAGKFSVSASGETPMTIYNAVTLNNNAITVNVTGATPLPVGIYTLLNEPNVIYSISGSFTNTPTITGAGLAAGTRAFVTTTTTAVKLTVVNSSVWTFNGNGNWTTGANWDSNPNYPNAAGQLAVLGVGSSLITVNLNASQTIGGISFTNANSFVVTNANNVLTLDNGGNGAQLGVTAGTANSIATGVSLNDTTTANVASGTALAVSGNVTGSAGFTVTGNGVLSLSGSNTYSGVTTLSGSTLVLGSTNAIGSGSLTIGSGKLDSSVVNLLNANNNAQNWNGSFAFLGSQNLNLGNGSVTLGNNLTVTVNTNKLTVGGTISGGFTLTYGATNVVNNGILELDGANDFSGLTLVSGTVALGNDNAFGSAAQIQLSPAALLPTAATNLTIMSKDSTAHTIANGMSMNAFDGPYIFGGTGDLTLSGTIATGNGYKRLFVINKTTISGQVTDNGTPSGQVAKDGPGTLVLTADNTTTKPFRVDAGTLALGSTTAIGSGALTINGGGLDSTVANLVNANNNVQTWAGSFYFAGSQNLNLGTGSVTMSANTTLTVSNNTLTVGGAVTGASRSLTKSGTGTLVLSGANTYSNTTVTAGTLAIAQATLATNSTVAISNSAVLQLDFSTTNQVAALVLSGVSQATGVYKAANSGGKITGIGALLVVPLAPTINPNPPVMQVSVSGSTLSLAWPTNAGWILQSNSVGLTSAAWFNYPANGAVDVTNVNITVDPAKTNVFFRMLKP